MTYKMKKKDELRLIKTGKQKDSFLFFTPENEEKLFQEKNSKDTYKIY